MSHNIVRCDRSSQPHERSDECAAPVRVSVSTAALYAAPENVPATKAAGHDADRTLADAATLLEAYAADQQEWIDRAAAAGSGSSGIEALRDRARRTAASLRAMRDEA